MRWQGRQRRDTRRERAGGFKRRTGSQGEAEGEGGPGQVGSRGRPGRRQHGRARGVEGIYARGGQARQLHRGGLVGRGAGRLDGGPRRLREGGLQGEAGEGGQFAVGLVGLVDGRGGALLVMEHVRETKGCSRESKSCDGKLCDLY